MTKRNCVFKILSLSIVSSIAISAPVISSVLNKNPSHQIFEQNDKYFSNKVSNGKSYVSVKSLNDESLTEEQKKNISLMYELKPSELKATESKNDSDFDGNMSHISLFNLLTFSDEVEPLKVNQSNENAPKITNLTNGYYGLNYKIDQNHTSNRVDTTAELPYITPLKDANGNDIPITQEYLDAKGILILRIDMHLKEKIENKNIITEFITITGFNSKLRRDYKNGNNIVLPANEYSKSVSEVSNNDLLSFPQFIENSNEPSSRHLISRVNTSKTGTINYNINFSYYMDSNNKIELSDPSSLGKYETLKPKSNSLPSISSVHNTSYNKEILLSGFQPAPNITEKEIIIILASIIGAGCITGAIVYLISILTQKIRFRNSY